MSARAPFTFPIANAAGEGTKDEPSHFTADAENPLHLPARIQSTAQPKRKEVTGTSGLASLAQRVHAGSTIARPGTAAPMTRAPHLPIATPQPKLALDPRHEYENWASTVYTHHYKTPRFVQTTKTSSAGKGAELIGVEPYENHWEGQLSAFGHDNQGLPANGVDNHEKIVELVSMNTRPQAAYTQQVNPHTRRTHQLAEPAIGEQDTTSQAKGISSRPNKRSHADVDDDHDSCSGYPPTHKRFKAAQSLEKTPEAPFSPLALPGSSSSASNRTRVSRAENYGSGTNVHNTQELLTQQTLTAEDDVPNLFHLQLSRILAEREHSNEQERKKWASCSLEEWKASGEAIIKEMSRNFTDIGEKMMSIKSSYQAIHDAADNRLHELDERKASLLSVQRRITEAGSSVLNRNVRSR
ncbi:hypothetical protein CVT24_005701 [Panaeolus cyanescens]|uniref:Extracellular mutant protein 11 C-terminal domain-containing protein n=1 Tax=Panaeolus cyanescens TaxID=181874 RepID=A0A409V989_9AGAR|nr:hypothetical protein CVT24_005701 [Panaeolus cyanescens]